MCTYNGGRFLEEQLLSIAGQTRLPFELVVCDDHSTDATCKIVQAFAASAPFPVRLYVNERNLGSTKNFEHANASMITAIEGVRALSIVGRSPYRNPLNTLLCPSE